MKIISSVTGLCINLPEPKSISSNGKGIVFIFGGFFPPFVLENAWNFRIIFEKEKYYGLSQKNEKKLVSEKFPKRSPRKKS